MCLIVLYTKASKASTSKASRFQSVELFLFSKVPKMKLRDFLGQKVPKKYFIEYIIFHYLQIVFGQMLTIWSLFVAKEVKVDWFC